MQIKYLKDAPTAQTGDICEVPDDQAQVLIILGFAEVYDENDSDNGNTGDLFGQLDDNQSTEQEPPETDETAEKATDDNSEKMQEVAETAPAEPATPTETPKPKKTKKTNTESN